MPQLNPGMSSSEMEQYWTFLERLNKGMSEIIVPVKESAVNMHNHAVQIDADVKPCLLELDGRPAMALTDAIHYTAGFLPNYLKWEGPSVSKPVNIYSWDAQDIREAYGHLLKNMYEGTNPERATKEYRGLLVEHGVLGEQLADQVVRRVENAMQSARQTLDGVARH